MSIPLRVVECVPDYHKSQVVAATPRRVTRRSDLQLRRVVGVGIISLFLLMVCLAGVGAVTVLHGLQASRDLRLVESKAVDDTFVPTVGSVQRAYGYVSVSGSVMNHGSAAATDAVAIVELLDGNDQTVQVDRAMIEFKTVSPGNASPFNVVVRDVPTAVGYRMFFRHADGSPIE